MLFAKRLLALALAAVLLTGLFTACGEKSVTQDDFSDGTVTDSTLEETTEPADITEAESTEEKSDNSAPQEELSDEVVTDSTLEETTEPTDTTEAEPAEESSAPQEELSDDCYEVWTLDETAAHSTDIVEAEFTGEVSYNRAEEAELTFKVVKSYKGSAEADAEICVVPYERDYTDKVYESGKTYMLLLQRFSSVYREYDTYCVLHDGVISTSDAAYESYVDTAKSAVDESPTYSIDKFTTSKDISEIADFADEIFVVTVDGIFAESSVQPTTVYNCSVVGTVKGQPVNDGNIRITLFNGTVEVGGKYVVFLADSQGTQTYTLAAKDGVYPTDSDIKEIVDLLSGVTPYTTAQIPSDDGEDIITDSPLPD